MTRVATSAGPSLLILFLYPHIIYWSSHLCVNFWLKHLSCLLCEFVIVPLIFLFTVCRCIAVKTTLSEETLKTADPSLVRNVIGNVSLQDILQGGSDAYSM